MLLEYTFDGNGNNTGITGANNLTVSGTGAAPTYTGPSSPFETGSSLDNSALTYNTVGQVLSAGSISSSYFTSGSLTITGWKYNSASLSGSPKIMDKGASATTGGFTLQFSGNNLNLLVSNGSSTLLSGTSSGYNYALANTWEWFGVTYDSSNGAISFYALNASNQVYLVNTISTAGGNYTNNANSIRIANAGAGDRAFDGYLDDLRLFNDVETIAQMQALVPEPSTWALLVAGLVVVIGCRVRTLRRCRA